MKTTEGDLEVLAKDLNPIELSANESKYNTTQYNTMHH